MKYTEIEVTDNKNKITHLLENSTNKKVASYDFSEHIKEHPLVIVDGNNLFFYSAKGIVKQIEVRNWLLKKYIQQQSVSLWQRIMFLICKLMAHKLDDTDKCLRCKVKFGVIDER
jgi:hypothetical protein